MLRFFISSFLKRSFVWRKKQTKALGRRGVNLAFCVRVKHCADLEAK
ncbi:hypothetical protein NYG92_08720 [Campylobacter felis]|nr:hypothetical protein [Campylobacter felis]MDL0110822.1 hypothetical protein [Campylobacter felis]